MLICASFAGAMGAFTSCKDTDDDQYTVLQREDFRLMQQIQELKEALQAAQDQATTDLNNAIADLNKQISEGYGSTITFKELAQKVKDLEGKVCACGDLTTKLTTLENNIKTWVGQQGYLTSDDINGLLKEADLDSKVAALLRDNASATYQALMDLGLGNTAQANALQEVLEKMGFTFTTGTDGNITIGLPNGVTDQDLQSALASATWVTTNKTALENLLNDLENIDTSDLLTKTEANSTYLTKEDFEDYKNSLKNDLDEFVRIYNEVAGPLDMKADFTDLNELLTDWVEWRSEITSKVAANETAIKDLQKKYNTIVERLDAMITSMIAEGTFNPVFGTFSVPAGVASNVLMAYYGEMGTVRFPAASSLYEFDGEQVLTSADIKMMGATPQVFSGTVLAGEDNNYVGNAGTLYLTVNPGNVDMTGKTFTLVNSQNTPSGMKLETPVKSNEVLTFGYSYNGRAAQDVSLYEAKATLTPENIGACKANTDLTPGLTSAAKKFFNDRSLSSMAGLMKEVYEQINGILPRLAVKAEWQYTNSKWDDTSAAWVDETQDGIVRTGLDVAATTFKPLSYKTLEGKKINRKLPIFGEVAIDWDKLIPEIKEIKIDPIDLSGITINFKLTDVDLSDIADNNDLTVTVSGDYNGETITLSGKVVPENLQNFIDDMSEQFKEQVKQSNEDINTEFAKIMKDLQDKINGMITNVNTQINDVFTDLMNQIKNNIDKETGKYFDKMNSLINRYNSLAERLNKIIENPNHYMQVTMLYKNNDGGFSFLSTNENAPSNFSLNGGNALMLFPTTYNLEIVSPAFKKFVGVCDVINLSNGKSAQEGDAAAKAALEKANNADLFAEVVEGKTLRVATGQLTAGFKYVVAYSALDYRGFTSTNKYYFQVN